MVKAKRKQKLKVFRTPIGFHDAYVAAPSQKAALEAWGAGTNLFSQGAAEQVSDPKLMKAALEHPGEVIKVARGTQSEQLAALARHKGPKPTRAAKPEIVPARPKPRPRKPSRAALTSAEAALEKIEARQAKEREAIDKEERRLGQRRREVERRHERELDKARAKFESEREDYRAAIAHYESG